MAGCAQVHTAKEGLRRSLSLEASRTRVDNWQGQWRAFDDSAIIFAAGNSNAAQASRPFRSESRFSHAGSLTTWLKKTSSLGSKSWSSLGPLTSSTQGPEGKGVAHEVLPQHSIGANSQEAAKAVDRSDTQLISYPSDTNEFEFKSPKSASLAEGTPPKSADSSPGAEGGRESPSMALSGWPAWDLYFNPGSDRAAVSETGWSSEHESARRDSHYLTAYRKQCASLSPRGDQNTVQPGIVWLAIGSEDANSPAASDSAAKPWGFDAML